MQEKSRMSLFENTPVPKAFFILTLPGLLARVVNLVYNMADTYFIAHTQNAALVAGVSLCAPIFMLTVALGDLFGLGSSSLMSRLFGQKETDAARNVSSFSFWAAVASGAVVGGLLLAFRTPVLHLLGAQGETFTYASQYYTWIALGAPVMVATVVPVNQLRTEGLTKESMVATMSGSVVNIVLDPLFIFTLGMGAAGAAIATVLGNMVTLAMQAYTTTRKAELLSLAPRHAHVRKAELLGILAIGVPAALNNLMQSFSGVLLNRSLAGYGVEAVAAMGITHKLYLIITLVMVSFAFGSMPLLGYSYGAGDRKKLRESARFGLLVQMVCAVCGGGLMALFAPQLLGLFMKDAGIVALGARMLRCMLMSMPFVGVFLVCSTLFQAAGKAVPTLVLALCRQGILFAVCLFVLSRLFGLNGVICTQAASDVLTTLLALVLLRAVGLSL